MMIKIITKTTIKRTPSGSCLGETYEIATELKSSLTGDNVLKQVTRVNNDQDHCLPDAIFNHVSDLFHYFDAKEQLKKAGMLVKSIKRKGEK